MFTRWFMSARFLRALFLALTLGGAVVLGNGHIPAAVASSPNGTGATPPPTPTPSPCPPPDGRRSQTHC